MWDIFRLYLTDALKSFDKDPPSTPYQIGFRDALREVLKNFDLVKRSGRC